MFKYILRGHNSIYSYINIILITNNNIKIPYLYSCLSPLPVNKG